LPAPTSNASGVQTPEAAGLDRAALLEKARRRQTLRVAIIGPLIFAGSLVGALIALRQQKPPAHLSSAGLVVIVAISAFPALAMLGLLALSRRGHFAWMQPMAFGGLARRQRRGILRGLRRGDPLADEDVTSARELMNSLDRNRWLPWLFVVLPILQVDNATSHDHVRRFFWCVAAAAFWASAWWQLYLRYRIRIYAEMLWAA